MSLKLKKGTIYNNSYSSYNITVIQQIIIIYRFVLKVYNKSSVNKTKNKLDAKFTIDFDLNTLVF